MKLEIGLSALVRITSSICLLLAALLLWPAASHGQSAPPPPVPFNVDERGVNLTTGDLVLSATDLSIGPEGPHGLRLSRQYVEDDWRHGWNLAGVPMLTGSTTNPIVSVGGRSVPFSGGPQSYAPVYQDGSALVKNGTNYTYTAADGTVIEFGHAGYHHGYSTPTGQDLGQVTSVTHPDGTVWTYHQTLDQMISSGVTYYFARLSSVTSSTGYQIKLTYGSNSLSPSQVSEWLRLASARAINNAVEFCDPTVTACNLTNPWPQVTYGVPGDQSNLPSSVTDPEGRTTNFTYSADGLTGIKASGASTDTVTFGYASGDVSSVSAAGSTWNYAYGYASGGYTTVTDPFSQQTTFYYTSGNRITSLVAGGQTTTFTYCGTSEANCPEGLLKTATTPEGNYVQYAYDARGNSTSVTRVAKSGSGLANIVTSAVFPSSCTNQKTCNKPTSTTDARGQVTDYTYDSGHGGLLTVTSPADANGVRPQTRITYSNYQAYYKNSAGSIVASGSNIALPTQVAACRTTSSCTNGTDERKTVIGYGQQTPGIANNLNPVSATISRGDGALSATTAVSYDVNGRIQAVDGPQSGTADYTLRANNRAGQPIWQIGPDPDGTGPAKHPATYYNYRSDAQIDFVQQGTVDNQLSGAWSTWVELQRQTASYDIYHRPARQVLSSGGTNYQVTDQVYDPAGRVLCTVLRLDGLASPGSLLTSCAPPQTTSLNGPDRVTYNHYDALGRVWKVTTGYGTTSPVDEQIATFSNNGRLATLTDAEANLTTYEYDGHDRLVKTYFPVGTKGAGLSNSGDYEQIGYDANGNVTSFRTRRNETLTMTYDNLNRLITKTVPNRSGNWCGLGASPACNTHTRGVFYAYDLFGNITDTRFDSASGQGIVNTFDALGRLASSTTNMDGVPRALDYLYDVAGNLTRITHPDGRYVDYTRHPSGQFKDAMIDTSRLFYLPLDAQGRPHVLWRYQPALATWVAPTVYGWDAVSRLSSWSHDPTGSSDDVASGFTYNAASQLATSTRDNNAYAWTGTPPGGISRAYTSNGRNQYSSDGGATFGYDMNGNLASATNVADGSGYFDDYTFIYDVENRLVGQTFTNRSASPTQTITTTLRYDPLGRLHEVADSSMGTQRFLYDGSDLVAEYDDGNPGTLLRRYVHGLGAGDDPLVWFEGSTIADSARRYLYADERGSIVAVTDASGNVTAVNTYDEYGLTNASGNDIATRGRFRYTGQAWLPELGMYYYKARMYSPTLGRFMQTDPIGYGDGMNMYAYVKNDPVNGVDPSGLETCFPFNIAYIPSYAAVSYDAEGNSVIPVSGGRIVQGSYCPDIPGGGPQYRTDPRGGTRSSGASGTPQRDSCAAPTNVNISGTLVVSTAMGGIASFTGELKDVASGRTLSFIAQGPLGEGTWSFGAGLGHFSVSGTLNGFDALSGQFSIAFATVGVGWASVGTGGIMNENGRAGDVDINATWAVPAGAAFQIFDGAKLKVVNPGDC